MSNNSNIVEENETTLNYLDILYDFLFKALCSDNIYNAIKLAEEQGFSVADISIVTRRILENYDDLAKVDNLSNKRISYLIISTSNTEFATELYEKIGRFYRERISKKDFNAYELENPEERVLFELFHSSFYRSNLSDFLREVDYPNHNKRITEACKKKQASDYDETVQIILEETNNSKDIQEILEDTVALLYNDWYGEDIFGKPTPREISIATSFLAHPGIKKYVMRNYKAFLQSSWNWYDSTEWSDLGKHTPYAEHQLSNIVIDYYLEKKGWTINDEGELISLTDNKPIKLDTNFPPAINMRETHNWLWAYRAAERDIKRLILDEWDQDIFGGKQPQIWKVKQIISETRHPGIMRYALKKYQKELIEYNKYDSLSEDIARIETDPESYEHLITLYDTVLSDNDINLDTLSERLEVPVNKQQHNESLKKL